MSKMADEPPPYATQQDVPMQITAQVMTVPSLPVMGPLGQMMTCPSCHDRILTRVKSEATTRTHMMALLLCVFGCLPCVCIPYCMDTCQNLNHFCPSCDAYLGAYQR